MNQRTPMIEIADPNELTIFHPMKLSGKSEYLLGIPASPRKCWGKKVAFTPINVNQK